MAARRSGTTPTLRRGFPAAARIWMQVGLVWAAAALLAAPPAKAEEAPSRLKILGLSLLLPGLGHISAGHGERAQGFLAAETATWGAFIAFEIQGKLRKESYVEMAELFGGVGDARGRSNDYYRLIGQYPSSEIYDEEIRRDARARHGDDLQAREAYYQRNRIPEDRVWSWASREARQKYREKRSDSNRSFKRAGYMIGVGVANRLLASVDAMRLLHRKDRSAVRLGIRHDLHDLRDPAQLCLTVRFP